MLPALHTDTPLPLSIEQLWVYPVKSCAGVRLAQAELLPTGLQWDRTWMVVDQRGEFLSQRELPRMALVRPRFRMGQLELQAPGMLSLYLALDAAEAPCKVRVWDDELDAYDMGDVAAQWFCDFLLAGRPELELRLRLVRFDPDCVRPSDVRWTGGLQAPNTFSDGYPLLLLSAAALAELNERRLLLGQEALGVERFRPNLLLGGLQAHDEDRLAELRFPIAAGTGAATPGAPAEVWLQPVKPCARCSIPDVDPATGIEQGNAVASLLQSYRQDRRLLGAVTFGMNAIVRQGAGFKLTQGLPGLGRWADW
ncbi:MAG: MOSC N-terminal beta barrel domain-containing protein [Serpentinimonas sp.]|nr:MAG: Fe-S protein [Comamonadaceae bacterium BICA1-1]MDO9611072.1 MOSC N-terminal beta barrel domain-containing protein [Serpentinimonas sp.]